MTRINTYIICALFTANYVAAQTVTVVDITTRQTIPGVGIISNISKITATTNAKGHADISAFKGADSIYFKHISYKTAVFSFSQLEAKKYSVELSEKDILLNELVVSASRWEEDQIEIPYRVEKLNMKDVALQNPQTSADMLGTSGYAYIQKSQLAGGSPMLRGFSTNRVMLVVDGVRMNNAIFRSGNLQNVISVDASSLEDTEILFGPGAVMYGSDAIGGVMDFHTMEPQPADTSSKLMFKGNSFGRFSSANTEKTGHLDFNIGLKNLAFISSITYSDYDDLRTGSKGNPYFLRPVYQETINGLDTQIVNKDPQMLVHSGYSQLNFMQKIRFKPNESWEMNYAFHNSATSNAPRYDRLYLDANNDSILDNAEWYYGPQKWMMNRIGITHSKSNKLYNQMRIVFANQYFEESRHDRKFNSKKIRHQTESVYAYSLNLNFDKKVGEKSTLFYGAEAVYNLVSSTAKRVHIVTNAEEPTATRYPDGSTWQAYGIFSTLKHKLSSKWILNTGLRYSYYMIQADFDTALFPFPFTHAENSNGALNGSAGLVFSPNNTLQIYTNASTGFRAPNIDDMGKVFESVPGTVVVPNADLTPEYAYNAEIGAAKTFGSMLKVDFASYYTLLDNALARRNFQYKGQDSILYDGQMSQVQAIQNITRAYVYGIQAGIDISLGRGVGFRSSFCYQKGEESSEDSLIYYPKPHVAPMFGSAHLTYKRKMFEFDFYVDYNRKMDYKDLPLSERNDDSPYAKDDQGRPFVPGWHTMNFKAAYYINKNLAVNAGVENITAQLYRTYASGISAPGRNIIAALKCKF